MAANTVDQIQSLRDGAARQSANVRGLARFAATSACPTARLGFGARVDLDRLLVGTPYEAPVGQSPAALALADPSTIEFILRLLQRLIDRGSVAQCEPHRRSKPVHANDIAVAVSHNDQKNLLRVALVDAGLTDVVEFHLDPGRLCVMLTRHPHACIVVGRAADRSLVEGIPPTRPAYVGWDENPALDGWYAHEAVFNLLEPHQIEVP